MLALALEHALSRSSVEVGRRLRTEKELAEVLGLGRWGLREALNILVEKGLLTRRRGSGTYLRKIPPITASPEPAWPKINPADLFAKAAMPTVGRYQPRPDAQGLNFGIWSNLRSSVPSAQGLLADISGKIAEAGHRLSVYSMTTRSNEPMPIEQIQQVLREQPSDGYIVMARSAARFKRAMGDQRLPVVYFWLGEWPVEDEPMITLDSRETTRRALAILKMQGYQRIGVIAEDNPGEPEVWKTFELAHKAAVEELGLSYRRRVCSMIGSRVSGAAKSLLSGADAADAVYVADDRLLGGVCDAIEDLGLEPGQNLGVITHCNRGFGLPGKHAWSRLEVDIEFLAQVIADTVLRAVHQPHSCGGSVSVHPCWIPGETHLRRA